MASKLSLGRSRLSKSVTITCSRLPSFADFRRQMSACTRMNWSRTHFVISPAREVIGRRASSAPRDQQPHPILQLEKSIFGSVRTRKCYAGEKAGAVVRLLVAIRAEHVIICTLLVVVLEKVARQRCPLDQLALLELIQLVADFLASFGLAHQEKQNVMKNVVCYE